MSFFSKPGCNSTRGLVEKFVTSGEYSCSDACTVGVRRIGNEVPDLCIGKPAVRSLPLSAAAGDLAAALRRVARSGSAACIAVVTGPARAVVGRLGLADVLCFLCEAPEALARPADALAKPVSALLPKDGAGEVRRVEPRAR
jgi:hypothetical protein